MFRYGVHRFSWGHFYDQNDLKTFFEQVAKTGADTVEFRPPDLALLNNQQKIMEIRQLAADKGIDMVFCLGYPPGFDMRSEDIFVRKHVHEYLSAAVRAVSALGGSELGGVIYSTWPPVYNNFPITKQMKYEQTQRCIEGIRQIMPIAGDFGVQLDMEVLNRFDNHIINTVEEGISFVRAVDSKNCGLLLDTFHMNIEEDDIPAAIRSARGYIGKLHVTEPNRKIPFHNKRINWPEIGKALKDISFDKSVVIEAIIAYDDIDAYNMRLWRDLIADTSLSGRIEELRKGVLFLKEQFGNKIVA